MASKFTPAELKKIEEAHGKGEALPDGVTFAPYNKPPYIATDEYMKRQEELDGGPLASGNVAPAEGSTPTG